MVIPTPIRNGQNCVTVTFSGVNFVFRNLFYFRDPSFQISLEFARPTRLSLILGSGLYRIHLPNIQAFTAYCDMETDGGGYLVFQRGEDGSVDFYRDYAEYVKGFGDQRGEHWLGLELLHRLTSAYKFKLWVDLADCSGQTAHASYSTFGVVSALNEYRLSVGGYSGMRVIAWELSTVYSFLRVM